MIQREIERAGIATVSISIVRRFTQRVRPPRSIFLDWPFGHPMGEAFNPKQQKAVLLAALRMLSEIRTPGEIVDLPWQWGKPAPAEMNFAA